MSNTDVKFENINFKVELVEELSFKGSPMNQFNKLIDITQNALKKHVTTKQKKYIATKQKHIYN